MVASSYQFKPITYYDVLAIEDWRYNGFEKRLYMDDYHESYNKGEVPLLGPRKCKGFSVFNSQGSLFGIIEFYFEHDGVHLGLAINPNYIGRGYSKEFILGGIDFLKREYRYGGNIFLEVHRKNTQGIKAYEKVGFKLYKRVDDELHYIY